MLDLKERMKQPTEKGSRKHVRQPLSTPRNRPNTVTPPQYQSEYVFASYPLVLDVVWVRRVGSFPEGCCLEVVNAGGGIRYVGFLNVAYPYRVDLGAGISSAGVRPAVYVPIIVFAGSVVSEPAGWRATTSLGGPVALFRLFALFSAVRGFRSTLAVIPFPTGADEFLPIRMTRVWDTQIGRAHV